MHQEFKKSPIFLKSFPSQLMSASSIQLANLESWASSLSPCLAVKNPIHPQTHIDWWLLFSPGLLHTTSQKSLLLTHLSSCPTWMNVPRNIVIVIFLFKIPWIFPLYLQWNQMTSHGLGGPPAWWDLTWFFLVALFSHRQLAPFWNHI